MPNKWGNECARYWSDYQTRYTNATEIDGSGIGDTPFCINENNQDNHPLMEPDEIPEFPSWTILPLLTIATLLAIICKNRLPKTPKQQSY